MPPVAPRPCWPPIGGFTHRSSCRHGHHGHCHTRSNSSSLRLRRLAANPGAGSCSGGTSLQAPIAASPSPAPARSPTAPPCRSTATLILTRGASLDDHGAELWQLAQVSHHRQRHRRQGRGSGPGLQRGRGHAGTGHRGGSIIADQPLALQVGNLTVGGSVISFGGGVPSNSVADSRNFPVKDNVIHGSLILQGWPGRLARRHPRPRRW